MTEQILFLAERQKVLRKISRTKRELETPDLPADQKKNMKSLLRSYRVQLNYILNYPKDQKYISLFPSKSSSSGEVVGTATEVRRAELLASIKKAMKGGEMDAEPETNYIVMEKERSDEEMPDADEGWSGSEPEQREQKLPNKVKNRPVEPRSPDQSSERLNDDFFEASSD
ncbi:18S rRNA maturation protein [Tulasnella sp. 418]|nr:18S rRNA maturation protein [Tulasnella sp. 418]